MNAPNTTKGGNPRCFESLDIVLKLVLTIFSLMQLQAGDSLLSTKSMLLGVTAILHLVRVVARFIGKGTLNKSSRSLAKFDRVIRHSRCPFARKAKLMGSDITLAKSIPSQVRALTPVFVEFTNVARKRKLDGIVLEINAGGGRITLKKFCSVFDVVLRTLAAEDPSGGNCFSSEILSPGWQFSFNRTRFFITTFAPFYDERHPRFSHCEESGYIYFQPEYSFDQHGIHAANPQRASIKEAIRQDFLSAGYELDVGLIEQPHEALKYIKPTTIGAPGVRWWEVDE